MLAFVLLLSVLIIAHEFGHFIVAKRSGVRVEKFAIGFGPVLYRRKGKETEFSIRAFPLGGYVKMAGDSRTDCHGKPDEFFAKSVGTKMAIVFAGPLFNYILGFIVFWIIAVMGFPYIDTVVGKLKPGFPAQAAGLKEGDKILTVNGKAVEDWMEMTSLIRNSKNKVVLKVSRDASTLSLDVNLKSDEIRDEYGRKKAASLIGIEASPKIKVVRYNVFEGFFHAGKELFRLTAIIVKGFYDMFSGSIPLKEAVTGPLGIYYITSEAVKVGILALLHLMTGLSVSLAIVNLLPLPLLDGGHIVLFLIEKIRGKQLTENAEDLLTRVGYAIFAILIAFVFYNDVSKFGSKLWGPKSAQSGNAGAGASGAAAKDGK